MATTNSSDRKTPFRKDFRNIALWMKRLVVGGVEFGVAKVKLVPDDAAGGVFTWRNMENGRIIVDKIIIDVTTKASAACTIDVGKSATVATADTLFDGLDVGTTAAVFDTIGDGGTNGIGPQALAQGNYITASKATGATAGLAGYAYIHWIRA